MTGTKGLEDISTKQQRIAELAKRFGTLTTLSHHVDLAWMREAHRCTRKDGAPGVDGQSAEEYRQRLEENRQSLLERAKAGTYRAPAVRRVHIPKGNGETRPIGIPTFEDKVLQRAVTMVLEAVYEQDFLPCSYGFRPGRNAHQCIEALRDAARKMAGGYLFRYADDAVMLFEKEAEARRVFEVLPKRFEKYGLTLHPEKTRLVRFTRPDRARRR